MCFTPRAKTVSVTFDLRGTDAFPHTRIANAKNILAIRISGVSNCNVTKKPAQKETPLIVFLRLTGEPKARMLRLCDRLKAHHNAIAEAGMLSEMYRLEQAMPEIQPTDAAAIAQARALGIDPLQCLTSAIEAHLAEKKATETPAA